MWSLVIQFTFLCDWYLKEEFYKWVCFFSRTVWQKLIKLLNYYISSWTWYFLSHGERNASISTLWSISISDINIAAMADTTIFCFSIVSSLQLNIPQFFAASLSHAETHPKWSTFLLSFPKLRHKWQQDGNKHRLSISELLYLWGQNWYFYNQQTSVDTDVDANLKIYKIKRHPFTATK